MALVGRTFFLQRLFQQRALQAVTHPLHVDVILAIEEEGGGVVLIHHVRNVGPVIAPAHFQRVHDDVVHRLDFKEIVDGVAQQQRRRLRDAKGLVAELLVVRADQAHDVAAGGKAHHGVVVALHTELICVLIQIFQRVADVVYRCIVTGVQEGAVPQHEHRIAQLMQLVCDGRALVQLCRGVAAVAGHHHDVLCVLGLGREIEQLHHAQRRSLGDLLLGVDLPGDLHTLVVVFNDKVHALGCIFGRRVADVARDRRIVIRRIALDPLVAVSIEPGPLDAGVFPQFLHGRLGGDVRLPILGCECRDCQAHCHAQGAHRREKLLHRFFDLRLSARPFRPGCFINFIVS